MIYHVAAQVDWLNAQPSGMYTPPAYAAEGFIHACKEDQVKGVLERYYKDQKGLVILHIEESLLSAPYKFEFVERSNDEFPHIFGPINTTAVVGATLTDQ